MSFENSEKGILQNINSDNVYTRLGVSRTASVEDIKKAYLTLAVRYHPDKGGDEDDFKNLNEAYDELRDCVEPVESVNETDKVYSGSTRHPDESVDEFFQRSKEQVAEALQKMKDQYAQKKAQKDSD